MAVFSKWDIPVGPRAAQPIQACVRSWNTHVRVGSTPQMRVRFASIVQIEAIVMPNTAWDQDTTALRNCGVCITRQCVSLQGEFLIQAHGITATRSALIRPPFAKRKLH